MNKKGFTLLEILLASTLFLLLMGSVMSAYTGIIRFKYIFQAKANMLESTYYMLEKVNVLIKDYVIDYEEYFNRAMVGCDNGYQANFLRNIGSNGYCDNFTHYGNQSSITPSLYTTHHLYYCSSYTGYFANNEKIVQAPDGFTTGCLLTGYQSYGQYALQFYDYKNNVDNPLSVLNDSDDLDLGKGPEAILNATGVQELYLISPDHKNRFFIRRALIGSGDRNHDGTITGDNEKRYTLQILRLKGFDAGSSHDFNILNSSGVYDGKIDTWACDYSQGFVCSGSGISNLYPGYNLPSNSDDGWVTLFDKNLTVSELNLMLYPTKNPTLAWAESNYQINPYFTIFLTTKLYGEIWQNRLGPALEGFDFSLQTTFNIKDNYTNH